MRSVWQVARTVLIEAVRRKEIYAIVLVASVLIGVVMTLDFFHMEGLTKFYREFALKVMSTATAVTVIVLSARQLPREFEHRTIYTLLARPITRTQFLLGKLIGVWLAAGFCLGLFMIVYLLGMWHLGGSLEVGLFLQYIYLQMVMMLLLATLGFALSMLSSVDAAVTFGVLLYVLGSSLASMMGLLYEFAAPLAQKALLILTWIIPQVMLFDLSEKTVHAEVWDPLSAGTMAGLTLYGGVFVGVYFGTAILLLRRKAL